jgi:hypothetical protein
MSMRVKSNTVPVNVPVPVFSFVSLSERKITVKMANIKKLVPFL